MLYLCCPVENRARYPLDFAAATCYIEPKLNNEGGRFMAAVTLPTHYRNVFAEQGYAQAEIDARIENNLHRIEFESCLRRMPIMGVPSTI